MSDHKYGAIATTVYGIKFPSKKQANRYLVLKSKAENGEITDLRLDELHKDELTFLLQPGFRDKNGKKWRAIYYIGDFRYNENGKDVVEDTKGMKTKVFRIKEKMFRYIYPDIEFRIT